MATPNRTPSTLNPLSTLRQIQRTQQEARAITRLAYSAVNSIEDGGDSAEELGTQLAAARVSLEVALQKLEAVELGLDEIECRLSRNGARPDATVVRLMRERASQEVQS